MSSLAATQADGYYVPSEYYDSGQYKKQSRNKFAGSKGHNQYLQRGVVRFELPHDGFCLGCGNKVGRGTRYNASKREAGNYFTTKIYEFRMKCRACAKCTFIIRTNPKERDFDYVEGIHRQTKEFDTVEQGTAGIFDTRDGNRMVSENDTATKNDGLARLERVARGKRKTMTEQEELQALMRDSNHKHYDDATSNAALRKTFRKDRRRRKERLGQGNAMGWKEGMELADATPEDSKAAKNTCFRDSRKEEQQKFKKVRTDSIFSNNRRKTRRVASRPIPQEFGSSSMSHVSSSLKNRSAATVVGRDKHTLSPMQVKSSSSLVDETSPALRAQEQQSTSASALSALACYDSDSA